MTHYLIVNTDAEDWQVDGDHTFKACGVWDECSPAVETSGRHPGFDEDEDTFDGDTAPVVRHGDEHRYLGGVWRVRGAGCAFRDLPAIQEQAGELTETLAPGRYEVVLQSDEVGDWEIVLKAPADRTEAAAVTPEVIA